MTTFLLGGILVFAVATTVECYLLLGRAQLLFTHAELILRALHTLLREVPSKSAQRTVAAIDEEPRRWFQTFRRLAELGDHLAEVAAAVDVQEPPDEPQDDVDVELARWADDGGSGVKAPLTAEDAVRADVDTEVETAVDEDETPTETFPAVPLTEPVPRVDLAGGIRLPREGTEPVTEQLTAAPIVDEVDLALIRFGLRTAEGHRR